MNTISSKHNLRSFRLRIAPQDLTLAQERASLNAFTEPFQVVAMLKSQEQLEQMRARAAAAPPPGSSLKSPINKAAKAASAPALGPGASACSTAAAALVKRRYFPAAALQAAAAAPDTVASASTPLSRSGIAATDRLAAIAVQQLTQRAWQHARKCRPGTRELRAADVAAIVKRGMFDFLHASGVVDEWVVPDKPAGKPRCDAEPRMLPSASAANAPVCLSSTDGAPQGTSAPIADPDDVDVPPPDQDGHDNLSAAPGPGVVDAPLDATPPAPTFQETLPVKLDTAPEGAFMDVD